MVHWHIGVLSGELLPDVLQRDLAKKQGLFFFRTESAVSVITASVSPFFGSCLREQLALPPWRFRKEITPRAQTKKRVPDKLSGLHGGIAQKMRARNFGGEAHQAVIFTL